MTRSQDRFKYSTLQTNPINSNQLYNKKFQVNFQMPSHIQNLMQNVSNYGNIQKNQSPKHYHFIQTIQKQSQSVQFQQQENRSRPFSQFQYNIVQQGNQERLKSLPDENDSKDINKNLNQPKKVNQMIRNQKNEQIKNSNFQIQKLKQQLSQINIKEYLKKSVVLKTPSNLIEIQKSMQNRMKQFSQQNDQNHNETDYDLESARSNISSNQINSNNRQIFSKHIKNNTLDYNINKQISVQFDKNDDSQEYYQQLQDKLSFLENKMKSIKQNIIQQDKLHLKRAASQDLQLNTTENKNNFFNKYEIQQQNKKKRDLDKRFQELLQNLPYKSKNQVSQKSFDFLNDQELKEWKEKFVPKDGITKKTIEFIKQEIQKSKESDNTKENQNPSILQSFITQQSQQSQIDTKPKILNKSIESSSQLILNLQQSLKNTKQRNQICSQNLKIMQQKDSVQRQDYYLTKVCNSVKNNIQNEFYDHFIQTIQAIQYSYTVKQPNSLQIQEKSIDLKQQVKYQGKKTLIFDLDETLIHCMDQKHDQSQIVLSIQFDNGDIVKVFQLFMIT